MRQTTLFALLGAGTALLAILIVTSCGGGGGATTPSSASPTPTPAPTPTPQPTPVINCSPLPPPLSRVHVKVHSRGSEYWTLDATPLVGPNGPYCALVGFTDGRTICPVRPEGDPQRADCEAYAVGKAKDTGRSGPTWTRGGAFCTGPQSGCRNSPDNQYQLWTYSSGTYQACAENFACGELMVEK
jgi:hypothetical protein